MTQILIAIFGLSALWMATGKSERMRKWAPVVGLIGQPAWLAFGVSAQAWGLVLISTAYTLVYARGVWVQFRP